MPQKSRRLQRPCFIPLSRKPVSTAAEQPQPEPAAVDVLGLGVVDEHAAVLQIFEFNAVPVEEIQQDLLAQAAQIAGDNQIIVRGPAACVPKMGLNGVIGGGGHGGPHIVGVLDALVHNFACGHMGDIGPGPSRERMTQPAPVTVHWAVGVRLPP